MVLAGGRAPDGRQVVSKAFIDLYGQSQITGLQNKYSMGAAYLNGYSYGWFISDATAHPGSKGPEISDQGLLGSTPWLDYGRGYAAAIFIRADLATGTRIWDEIRPLILARKL